MPKFVTKKGWLTRYALACGYMEISLDREISLCLDGVYHVRHSYHTWECFDDYELAKKYFIKLLKDNNLRRKIHVH